MNRYIWIQSDGRYLSTTSDFKKEDRITVPAPKNGTDIFVNILEVKEDKYRNQNVYLVKLFYYDGTVLQGWTALNAPPIKITNMDELLDGRFNQ